MGQTLSEPVVEKVSPGLVALCEQHALGSWGLSAELDSASFA